MMNLFLTNTKLFASQDVNRWTGVVWITCGLLWCFYQLFRLSFWRHPFTAEDPLVSKWCNAVFLQICSDEETNTYILDGLRVSVLPSCVHIWLVSCPCLVWLLVNSHPAVFEWLCVNYPVYLSFCLFSKFCLVYLLLPGVPLCLWFIKDCYFELFLVSMFLVLPRCVHRDRGWVHFHFWVNCSSKSLINSRKWNSEPCE